MLRVKKADKRYRTPSHKRAVVQERETAIRLGGTLIKGSGSGHERGDSRVRGVVRIENKCTMHKSFSVTLAMLDKIERAALAAGEMPAIEIEFLDSTGAVLRRVAVVPAYALDALVAKDEEE